MGGTQVDQEVMKKLTKEANQQAINQNFDAFHETLKKMACHVMQNQDNYNSAIMEGKNNETGRTILTQGVGIKMGIIMGKVEEEIKSREGQDEFQDENARFLNNLETYKDQLDDDQVNNFVNDVEGGLNVTNIVDTPVETMKAGPKPDNKKKDDEEPEYETPGLR